MPVRSFNSCVLKWPKADEVIEALQGWADRLPLDHPELLRIGYFGSYARGNSGVGSDLDVIIIVRQSNKPFIERAADWMTTELPVPVDVLVYTEGELKSAERQSAFTERLGRETIWII